MDALTIVFGAVDLPLVIGTVVLLQLVKKNVFPKITTGWWTLVAILCGFLIAWLKVNILTSGSKAYIVQGIIYAAAIEFAYQMWKTLTSQLTKRKGK